MPADANISRNKLNVAVFRRHRVREVIGFTWARGGKPSLRRGILQAIDSERGGRGREVADLSSKLIGNSIVISVPFPSSLSSRISPPIRRTNSREMESPRPDLSLVIVDCECEP